MNTFRLISGLVIGLFYDFIYKKTANELLLYKNKQKTRTMNSENRIVLILTWISIPVMTISLFCSFSFVSALIVSVFCYLSALTVYVDERIRIIPNEIMIALFVLENLFLLLNLHRLSFLSSLSAMGIIIGTFVLTILAGKLLHLPANGIGAGDLKFMMVISYFVQMDKLTAFFIGFIVSLLIRILILAVKNEYLAGRFFPMGFHIYTGLFTACISLLPQTKILLSVLAKILGW